MAYRQLLFDADGTLLDFSAAEAEAFELVMHHYGLVPTAQMHADYSAINQHCWELLEQGAHTRDEIVVLRFAMFFERYGQQHDPAEANRLMVEGLGRNCTLYDDSAECLRQLHGHYRIAIITNGTASVQQSRFAASGLLPYIDAMYISQQIGAEKPSAAFFDHVFADCPDYLPAESLVIGDSLTADIAGGNRYGLDTCLIARGGLPHIDLDACPEQRPTYQITRLAQLFDILQQPRA